MWWIEQRACARNYCCKRGEGQARGSCQGDTTARPWRVVTDDDDDCIHWPRHSLPWQRPCLAYGRKLIRRKYVTWDLNKSQQQPGRTTQFCSDEARLSCRLYNWMPNKTQKNPDLEQNVRVLRVELVRWSSLIGKWTGRIAKKVQIIIVTVTNFMSECWKNCANYTISYVYSGSKANPQTTITQRTSGLFSD